MANPRLRFDGKFFAGKMLFGPQEMPASSATANGVAISAAASLLAGTVSGQINATAGGVIRAASPSLLSGSATGEVNSAATGVTLTTAASLLPGFASVPNAAPGVVLVASSSIIVGSASGTASASGVTLLAATSLLAGAVSNWSLVAGRRMRFNGALLSGKLVFGVRGLGVLGSDVPSTGDDGAGILRAEVDAYSLSGYEVRMKPVSLTAGYSATIYEDTSAVVTGPNGVATLTYDWWVAGIQQEGPGTVTFTIGAVDGSAGGQTFSPSTSLVVGSATGQRNATVNGVTLSASSTLLSGSASGEVNASAPSSLLTFISSLSSGTAVSGEGNATAAGSLIECGIVFATGSATGQQSATAIGRTFTSTSSFISGLAGSGVVWPDPATVLTGIVYGPTGTEYVGTLQMLTLAELMSTVIPVNVKKMNDAEVIGDGSEGDPWRGVGVSA